MAETEQWLHTLPLHESIGCHSLPRHCEQDGRVDAQLLKNTPIRAPMPPCSFHNPVAARNEEAALNDKNGWERRRFRGIGSFLRGSFADLASFFLLPNNEKKGSNGSMGEKLE